MTTSGQSSSPRSDVVIKSSLPVLSTQQENLLYRAYQVAFAECVSSRGFRYWPEPLPEPSLSKLFPYVIDNAIWARSNGFGDSDGSDSDARSADNPRDPNLLYYNSLTPPQRAALVLAENAHGPKDPGIIAKLPTGQVIGFSRYSCYAIAGNQLYGSRYNWYQGEMTYYFLPSLWQAEVEKDPRFAKATESWAACMKQKGEPYASPSAAATAFISPLRPLSSSKSRAAFRAAVSEALCANSTELSYISRKLDAHYKALTFEGYRDSVELFRKLAMAALPRAAELVRTDEHGLAGHLWV